MGVSGLYTGGSAHKRKQGLYTAVSKTEEGKKKASMILSSKWVQGLDSN